MCNSCLQKVHSYSTNDMNHLFVKVGWYSKAGRFPTPNSSCNMPKLHFNFSEKKKTPIRMLPLYNLSLLKATWIVEVSSLLHIKVLNFGNLNQQRLFSTCMVSITNIKFFFQVSAQVHFTLLDFLCCPVDSTTSVPLLQYSLLQ